MSLLKKSALCCLVFAGASASWSQTFTTLTSGDSAVRISRVSGEAGTAERWVMGTSFDQLSEKSFFYRTSLDTQERSVSSLGDPFVSQSTANSATFSWDVTPLSVSITYTLNRTATASELTSTVRLVNSTSGTLAISLYEYADFDLFMGADNDEATLGDATTIRQTDGSAAVTHRSLVTPNFREVSLFPDTLLKLVDTEATNLGNGLNSVSGDATFGVQWDLSLDAGQDVFMTSTTSLVVPEPTTVAFVGLGLLGLARRKLVRSEM